MKQKVFGWVKINIVKMDVQSKILSGQKIFIVLDGNKVIIQNTMRYTMMNNQHI